MNQQSSTRTTDDDLLELPFIQDYSQFALQMNFRAIVPLLKAARATSDSIERKSICLSGKQFLYSSYEDFAILLNAFRNRSSGKHLHLTIGVEDQGRKGSTTVPSILKRYDSIRQILDDYGFSSLTDDKISQYYNIPTDKLENHFRDVADSLRIIGEDQETANDYKNKLKHGKPVLEDGPKRPNPDYVLFPRWSGQDGSPVLEYHWMNASLEQLETATILVAKIYRSSLDLLGLFVLNYYPDQVGDFLHKMVLPCGNECAELVSALGLHSKGLTM
ncbi:MAG: hypothetical protein OXC18_03770 [Desulfurellaceae bacterium]|nr:hypothetical protein [Desulfurellaceae bacterium]